jgi:hypothetical protein
MRLFNSRFGLQRFVIVWMLMTSHSAPSWAGEQTKYPPSKPIPADARLLHEAFRNNSARDALRGAEVCEWHASDLRQTAKKAVDFEYECESVVNDFQVSWIKYKNFGDPVWTYQIQLRAFCIPRSLFSKQLYTASLSCEKDPQEYCWSDSFRKQLESFNPTRYSETWNGSCR